MTLLSCPVLADETLRAQKNTRMTNKRNDTLCAYTTKTSKLILALSYFLKKNVKKILEGAICFCRLAEAIP